MSAKLPRRKYVKSTIIVLQKQEQRTNCVHIILDLFLCHLHKCMADHLSSVVSAEPD